MPIEDTTENIKSNHESAEPGAKPNRIVGEVGAVRTRVPNRTQHATGDAKPRPGVRKRDQAQEEIIYQPSPENTG